MIILITGAGGLVGNDLIRNLPENCKITIYNSALPVMVSFFLFWSKTKSFGVSNEIQTRTLSIPGDHPQSPLLHLSTRRRAQNRKARTQPLGLAARGVPGSGQVNCTEAMRALRGSKFVMRVERLCGGGGACVRCSARMVRRARVCCVHVKHEKQVGLQVLAVCDM